MFTQNPSQLFGGINFFRGPKTVRIVGQLYSGFGEGERSPRLLGGGYKRQGPLGKMGDDSNDH